MSVMPFFIVLLTLCKIFKIYTSYRPNIDDGYWLTSSDMHEIMYESLNTNLELPYYNKKKMAEELRNLDALEAAIKNTEDQAMVVNIGMGPLIVEREQKDVVAVYESQPIRHSNNINTYRERLFQIIKKYMVQRHYYTKRNVKLENMPKEVQLFTNQEHLEFYRRWKRLINDHLYEYSEVLIKD